MIPLKVYKSTRSFPIVTALLIILNIAVFIQDRLSGTYKVLLVETTRGVAPIREFIGGLTAHYALVPVTLLTEPAHAWLTILTSMFLHGNWLHVGSNMLYLWIFGASIEDIMGRSNFLLFYFGCGIAAALTQWASDPLSAIPMVGASGAVAGVMGAYILRFPTTPVLTLIPLFIFFTTIEIPAFIIIGYWALIQFVNATWLGGGEFGRGGVAYFAHIGGFISGMLLLFVLAGSTSKPRRRGFPY